MLKSLTLSVVVLAGATSLAIAQMSTPQASSHHKSSLATTDRWLASDIYKAAVYDTDSNKIGDIDDLVLDSSGQIKTAVIGVGGFLGIGQKNVAVPFNELKVMQHNGRQELALERTRQQLKDAPAYENTVQEQ
jgi:sporulation protein YlmC with PRC-barrel domain